MKQLSDATLATLAPSVQRLAHDRGKLTPGIVHLGVGAFHRAHMAVMTDAVLSEDPSWGIIAASLRSSDTRDALAPQDGLYAVAVKAPDGEKLSVVGAILKVLVAPEDPEVLISTMADPRIRIVSLTVTEKGYCHDPATSSLNERHPDVIHDLANPARPRSAPGYVLAALARRRLAGIPPFTVLCCDNLPSNGKTVRRVLIRMAEMMDQSFGDFVRETVSCPCTMVDRIVPATTDDDRKRISSILGVEDRWPVVTEPFSQWVIEDSFPLGRPLWEKAGAQFTRDVEAFEHMKLRCLNGAHSTLAYLGSLAGHVTVAEATNDPRFIKLLEGFWSEVTPTLRQPEGQDLAAYCAALLARFQNRAIRHLLLQIAMDGSQKLPQRLLGSIRDNLVAGRPIAHLSLGVAAWISHVAAGSAPSAPFTLNDPMAGELKAAVAAAGHETVALTKTLLGLERVFGSDLPNNEHFTKAATDHVARLLADGPAAAMAAV